MRMQEVITQLRKLAPTVADMARGASKEAEDIGVILGDMDRALSVESTRSLAKLATGKMGKLRDCINRCLSVAVELQAVNQTYREKIGPGRKTKRPRIKDHPGQMIMPFPDDQPDSTTSSDMQDGKSVTAVGVGVAQ